jgi:hypothetical protein
MEVAKDDTSYFIICQKFKHALSRSKLPHLEQHDGAPMGRIQRQTPVIWGFDTTKSCRRTTSKFLHASDDIPFDIMTIFERQGKYSAPFFSKLKFYDSVTHATAQ